MPPVRWIVLVETSKKAAVGEIASLKHGTPRLVSTIGRDLFLADRQQHIERLKSFSTPDLTGEEYGMGPAAAMARAG